MDNAKLIAELLPCPFCGGTGVTWPPTCTRFTPYNPADRAFPIVRCYSCCAEAHGTNWGHVDTAIAAWNRRAALSAQSEHEQPQSIGDAVETDEQIIRQLELSPRTTHRRAAKLLRAAHPVASVPISPSERKSLIEALMNYQQADEDGVMVLVSRESLHQACDILRNAPVASAQVPTFDMLAHLQRQREWSGKTFGPGARAAGVVDHIRKELVEVEADPGDLKEWIDVVILALDGAWRAGYQPQQIIDGLVAKQTKNEARAWPDWRTVPEGKAIEHDRLAERNANG